MSSNKIFDRNDPGKQSTESINFQGANSYQNQPYEPQPRKQSDSIHGEKKSIFGDEKNNQPNIQSNDNARIDQNRSRSQSNFSNKNDPNLIQNQQNFFQNPLINNQQSQNPYQFQQQNNQSGSQQIQGKPSTTQWDPKYSSNQKASVQQSQLINLNQSNYNPQQQQQQPLRDSLFPTKTQSTVPINQMLQNNQYQDQRQSMLLQQSSNMQQQQQGNTIYQNEMRQSTVVKIDPRVKQSVGPNMNPQLVKAVPYFFNKRCVVTGASSGVGRAIAIWLLNSGAQVALVGRDLEALVEIGKQFPKQALVIRCDLSKDDQPYDMATTVVKEFDGLDILVNAAGILVEGDTKSTFPRDFDYMTDVNLRSVYFLSFLFQHTLSQSKGCIINVSGVYGSRPFAGLYAYCMTKAGVETLTKHLALELAPKGVRVNCVSPGMIDTNLLVYRKLDQGEITDIQDNAIKFNPLKRLATVDDVGKAVIFLCSQAANHLTGQILKVDGGRNLTSSGWKDWKGQKASDQAMESTESTIKNIKNIFSSKSTFFSDIKEKIDETLKTTVWSTTDKNAHASVKSGYQAGEGRYDAKESTLMVQQAFDKTQRQSNMPML